MDASTILTVAYVIGGLVVCTLAVLVITATLQLFAIRRALDELVRQGRERQRAESIEAPTAPPAPELFSSFAAR